MRCRVRILESQMEKNMEIEVEIFRVSCWRVGGGT